MRIYLGAISPADIQQARAVAPSYEYGATWTPAKATEHDWPFILDNGVYSAHVNDEEWNGDEWLNWLGRVQQWDRDPDFVVLPDVVGEQQATYERTDEYWDKLPRHWTRALAVQDGMQPEQACRFARGHGCEWIFIGGTMRWKRNFADQFVMTAHDFGLKAHIARPGLPDGLMWAEEIGADSVDTTTIARGQAYHHLQTLEEQTTLEEVTP